MKCGYFLSDDNTPPTKSTSQTRFAKPPEIRGTLSDQSVFFLSISFFVAFILLGEWYDFLWCYDNDDRAGVAL